MAALTDAIFVFLLAFFTTPISDRIGEQTLNIANKLAVLLAEGKTGILKHLFRPELRPMTGKMVLLILLYFLVIYAVYVLLQGISWWLSARAAGQKKRFWNYYLSFAKINITWAGLFVAGMLAYTAVEMRHVVVKTIAPGSINIAGNIMLLLFAILALTVFFSYPNMKKAQLFKTPLKLTLRILILSIAAIAITRYVLNLTAGGLMWKAAIAGVEVNAAAILLSLVFFFVINLIKVFIIKVLSNVRA
jgi:hypothetical protein